MAVVVDANLVVTLTTGGPRRQQVATLFNSWEGAREALHAPDLLRYEVASALTGLLAGGLISDELVEEAWAGAMQLPIALHPLVGGPDVIRLARRLARRSAYDAAYIALAVELGTDLWTLDGPLARNARGSGLPVQLVEPDEYAR